MYNQALSPGFKFRPRKGIWTDGKNNEFDPKEFQATSYNWWTYVAKINGKVVFNAFPYSNTTQNHQRNMRALLKTLKIKIDVTVNMRKSLDSFKTESLAPLYEELFTIELKATRARKDGVYSEATRTYYKTHAAAIKSLKASIKTCRALGAQLTRAQIKAIKDEVLRADASRRQDARLTRAKAKAARDAVKADLNDLSPVSLKVFEDVSNLDAVKL